MKKSIKSMVSEMQMAGMNAVDIFEKLKSDGIKTTMMSVKWYFRKNKKAA